jgi:hypothetical protein
MYVLIVSILWKIKKLHYQLENGLPIIDLDFDMEKALVRPIDIRVSYIRGDTNG